MSTYMKMCDYIIIFIICVIRNQKTYIMYVKWILYLLW